MNRSVGLQTVFNRFLSTYQTQHPLKPHQYGACRAITQCRTESLGGLHMHCYNTEIDVWFVSLPDAPKCGYYENDVNQVAEMLKDAEDQYLIEKQNMLAGRYYNLKEFDGF